MSDRARVRQQAVTKKGIAATAAKVAAQRQAAALRKKAPDDDDLQLLAKGKQGKKMH
jgi:hypothetical protein